MAGFLTATVAIGQSAPANLFGDAILSAAAFQSYLMPAPLAGGGVLDISAKPQALVSAGLAGAGALTGPISPVYLLSLPLASDGALSATATQVPFPTITNITTSPFHVGDTLTLTGTGFTGTVTVKVGGVAATSVSVTSSTSLTCVVPSVALGAQGVVVTAASGASGAYSITLVSSFNGVIDDFNRANSTTSAGTNWTNRLNVVGINGNALYPVTANVGDIATHNTTMTSDDMAVTITLGSFNGTPISSDQVLIPLGCNSSGQGALGFVDSFAGEAYIWMSSVWGSLDTAIASNFSFTPLTTADTLTLHRIGDVYTLVKNGNILICRGVATTAVIPRDSSHRFCGVGGYNESGTYRRIDNWQAENNPAALPFMPFTETNAPRTNQTTPVGCTGAWLTLIGAGAGGGSGRYGASSSNKSGGSGGGAGGFVPRTFVPVANMGATYTVAVQTAASAGGASQTVASTNGNPGTAGAATTFVSGATSISCGGGGAGGGGTTAIITGGTGGAVTGITGDAGTAGGNSSIGGVATAGTDNGTSVSGGAGGGGGGGHTNSGGVGTPGKGGNTNGQTGGAAATGGANAGNGAALVAAVAGSGGGGGIMTSTASFRKGGNGPGYGAGGGGGGAMENSASGAGGTGGPGYAKVEWV